MRSPPDEGKQAKLRARPGASRPHALAAGLQPLGLGQGRDGLIVVPPGCRPEAPAPLLVLLHGAGADAACLLPAFREQADVAGLVVLAPDSRGGTWDMILGQWGPDIAFLDAALDHVFSTCAVRIFMSHGTRDGVLPVDRCSRPLRQRLERAGYEVRYREFDGEHSVPPAVQADAFRWWLEDGPSG